MRSPASIASGSTVREVQTNGFPHRISVFPSVSCRPVSRLNPACAAHPQSRTEHEASEEPSQSAAGHLPGREILTRCRARSARPA